MRMRLRLWQNARREEQSNVIHVDPDGKVVSVEIWTPCTRGFRPLMVIGIMRNTNTEADGKYFASAFPTEGDAALTQNGDLEDALRIIENKQERDQYRELFTLSGANADLIRAIGSGKFRSFTIEHNV